MMPVFPILQLIENVRTFIKSMFFNKKLHLIFLGEKRVILRFMLKLIKLIKIDERIQLHHLLQPKQNWITVRKFRALKNICSFTIFPIKCINQSSFGCLVLEHEILFSLCSLFNVYCEIFYFQRKKSHKSLLKIFSLNQTPEQKHIKRS